MLVSVSDTSCPAGSPMSLFFDWYLLLMPRKTELKRASLNPNYKIFKISDHLLLFESQLASLDTYLVCQVQSVPKRD